jgi:hypothetical protein
MYNKCLGPVNDNLQPLGSGRSALKSYHCMFVYICVLVLCVYIFIRIYTNTYSCMYESYTRVCKIIHLHTYICMCIHIRRCTDLSLGPARARIEIQERRRIIGHNNEAAIQEPEVVGGVVRPHQERHRFGATAEATRALAVPALRRGGRRRKHSRDRARQCARSVSE